MMDGAPPVSMTALAPPRQKRWRRALLAAAALAAAVAAGLYAAQW